MPSTKPKVLIRRCDQYDADRIAGIVREGMEELGARPTGRILLKPNVEQKMRKVRYVSGRIDGPLIPI